MRTIRFQVDGLPPRKGYAYSLWNVKNSDWQRVERLRRKAVCEFAAQPKVEAPITLSIEVHAPTVGAGDLANFVNGICDALQAAPIHMKREYIAPAFRPTTRFRHLVQLLMTMIGM